ncbi:hypothetical protein [Actinacidiphila acidipaludis]|uniref:DUF4034 domain-containing protein n=1 Tax=Actinacidiphila acidipaludis TaxID=2873382 RepID=A0ABS7QF90_9ACTN|nr:hypothetical protein [Streptomyces acidipaludis]MBY8881506.1 hypothetical protein [Streptomyces acidipaludis]
MIHVLPLTLLLVPVLLNRRVWAVLRAHRASLTRWTHPLTPAALWARFRFDPAAYGLPPRDELDARRSGPPLPVYRRKEMHALADACREKDWRPAAAYVEAAGHDWDERWSRVELLQEISRSGSAWVDAWRLAEPGNCDAATLHALLLVHQAWEVRGSGYASQVPAPRMAQFRALLPAAIEAARQAVPLGRENPGPWVVMITAARGAQYSPRTFDELWSGLVARAPHHYVAHWQALQFWCAKWAGSDAAMLEFAKRAVERAPEGSPLAATYVHALRELEARHGRVGFSREARALLRRVAVSLRSVPAGDERLPPLRHLLAYYLGDAGLHDAALEQFRLIGRWCGAEPWTDAPQPLAAFELARATAARKAKGARTRKGRGPGGAGSDVDRSADAVA